MANLIATPMAPFMQSTKSMGTATVGYVRVSTLGQVNDGDSLAMQSEKIAAWCTFQGVPFDAATGIEADAGISGASTDNRPAFKRAMRRVLEGAPGSVLVVYKLDRLGRNAIDVQETLAVLLDAGVRVVSLADGVDSASSMGAAMLKLLTSILATFAELEKETIRGRLLDGRKRAKHQGRAYSRDASYGVRKTDDGKLEENADELRAVARIRELRAANVTIRAIASKLLEEGIRPRRAATWSTAVVLRLAKGERGTERKKRSERITKARAAFLTEGS